MYLIKLGESIKLFGFRMGFPFWFRWNFIMPTQEWFWLNISHKPYCLAHGFFSPCDKTCIAQKLYNKKDIKKHWEEIRSEEFGGYY